MISRLRGYLIEKQPPTLLLEVGGYLTYELQASMQTFYQLPNSGSEVLLYTHLLVREEAHTLYGFLQQAERALFRELLRLNGIGPKVALALLSHIDTEQLLKILSIRDVKALQHIPGIGKKTAERLLLEMSSHLKSLQKLLPAQEIHLHPITIENFAPVDSIQQDAIQALTALGYKTQLAAQIVHKIPHQNLSVEQLIRLALQAI
jgi:holliday junction DNA helicase RuvA